MKPLLNLAVNGYYLIQPHFESWSEILFHPYTSELSLETMQSLVGGYIECIFIGGSADGIVNEEGKLQGLRHNPLATQLYGNPSDEIVGTMLVLCGNARLT